MIPTTQRDQRKLCRTCGEDITSHAKYPNWTQCAYCYWKDRLDKHESLEVLLRRRGELKKQKELVANTLTQEQGDLRQHSLRLEAQTPWWKKLLGINMDDERSRSLRASISKHQQEDYSVEREIRSLTSRIQTARHIKKRFDEATRMRVSARRRMREAEEKMNEFVRTSQEAQDVAYDRHLFRIRKKDYKRGNLLDNHFRNIIAPHVLAAFDNKCLVCGVSYDLTLDHFAIPKNEGGNFVLFLKEDNSIEINVVILCRSCNASKGGVLLSRLL